MYVCTYVYRCLKRPEYSVGFSGAGVTGGCELPDVDTGDRTPHPVQKQKMFLTTKPPP